MNTLPLAKRAQILSMLCEGSSMRSISRVVDVSINSFVSASIAVQVQQSPAVGSPARLLAATFEGALLGVRRKLRPKGLPG